MGGPSSLGLGLSSSLPSAPGPRLLTSRPSSTTSPSCPSVPYLSLPFAPLFPPLPLPLLLPVSFSFPSILKEERTELSSPTGDTPRFSVSLGIGPLQGLEPLLTSRVHACVCGGVVVVNLGWWLRETER